MTTKIIAYPVATTWLYTTLTATPISGVSNADGVTGGAVFEHAAPEQTMGAGDKWIEFEAMAPGLDAAEVAAQRIWTEYAFLVRAISRGRDTIALGPIAAEIDARLDRAAGTTTTPPGRVISCTRADGSEDPDSWLEQGVEYRALGAVYHLIVQSLNP